jgi:hypothetical protein
LYADVQARVVGAAVILLSLGAATATAPAVGANTAVDGETLQPTAVDTRNATAETRNAVPGEAFAPPREALGGAGGAGQSSSADDGTLNVSYTYRRLPDERDVVEVRMRIPATPGVDRVRIGFPEGSTVVTTDNVRDDGSTYEWTGDDPATVVYRLRIDWSYTGNSRDSWTLLEHLPPTIRSDPAVEANETIAVAGTGYVGNRTLVLGDHDVYRRQVEGQTIDLVVPGDLPLRYGPDRTADALANVSRSLAVGARDEVVHAFATPKIRTEATILEFDGFALDGNTVLVDADAELAAWIHEYVHTRQAFSNAESLRWLTEGSARYYEWLLAIESGYADWGDLRGVLGKAANDDSVLADPDTWGGESEYAKGALVLAAVDREIRAATDGERTLEDALRRINGRETAPTVETFVRAVSEVGGLDAGATAERYVTTAGVPEVRSTTEAFEATYGFASPQLRSRVLDVSAVGADGARPVEGTGGRIPLALDETFRITVRVENAGTAPGLAAVRPRLSTDRLGGDYVDTTWVGWVGPNESVTETVTHRFGGPGSYDVTWNGGRYDLRVAPDRGTASVAGLTVAGDRPDDGRAAVEVTVRNDGDRATYAAFPVTVEGERASTIRLVLDGGEARTVTVRVDAPPSTPTVVGVGDASTTVGGPGAGDPATREPTSRSDTTTTTGSGPPTTTDRGTPTTTPGGGSPGFGVPAVLVVVALIGTAGLRRRTGRRR